MLTISIITSVFNGCKTIGSCIESVLSQSCPVEHIIVDGGSTDGTLDVVKGYGDKISRIIYGPDRGVYDGMNKGLSAAQGDVVGFLNADDFYPSPDVISTVVGTLSNENMDSCYGDLIYIDDTKPDEIFRFWKSGPYRPNRFYWGWMPPHPTFFVKRSIYSSYAGFDLTIGSSADYELMLRFLLKYRIRTEYIPKVLVKMRTGGISNASIRNRLSANYNDRKAWKINALSPYPFTLFLKPLRKLGQFFYRYSDDFGSANLPVPDSRRK
jgi:glycosyltransferase involved in cell wall biosynthesis